jgi:hypothetical protein
MSTPSLVSKVRSLHVALEAARVSHAFGGALALAYYIDDVRATKDIDLNVFGTPEEVERVLTAMPEGVVWSADEVANVRRDAQVRLWWDATPVDLFFDVDDIHRAAADHQRLVPFAGVEIPILGSTELTVFKMMYSRAKDWVDIAAMLDAGTVDVDAVSAAFGRMMGRDHPALARLTELAHTDRSSERVEPIVREILDRGGPVSGAP